MLKEAFKSAAKMIGVEVHRVGNGTDTIPVEFTERDAEILDYVRSRKLTMASPLRIIATINACKHAVEAEIPGDFVECGVWRGGNSLAAKMTFEAYRSDKRVFLFDTFAGMTAPTEHDTSKYEKVDCDTQFERADRVGHNAWCYASLADVRASFEASGVDMDGVRFVQGDVMKTLRLTTNKLGAIAVLRLDTDFYDSTKAEMEVLYPRLSSRGSLLLDDFGYWDGSRKAVTEYIAGLPPKDRPLLNFTDTSGRMAIKP